MSSPFITVIVPNYNHAAYLCQRVDSILNQTYQDFELILLDDCSTDDSKEILLSYKDNPKVSKIVFNETNGGTPFKQWNKGIDLARGEWIWIAESDDVADSRFLETLMQGVEKHPECGFSFTWTRRINTEGEVLHLYDRKDTNRDVVYSGKQFVNEKLLLNCSIDNVSECVFRKDLYNPHNSVLYEDMRLCGDWFFYVLMTGRTNVLEIQTTLSNYRMHGTNVTSSAERKGLTFLEGVRILDFIVAKYGVSPNRYSKSYAQYWLNNVKTYNITGDVNEKIRSAFIKNHKRIVLWHDLLQVYRNCKSLVHKTK